MRLKQLLTDPLNPEIVIVPLTKGAVAVVDASSREAVEGFNWHLYSNKRRRYAKRSERLSDGRIVTHYMHVDIWKYAGRAASEVDHHDSDGLNNRMSNLRAATRSQNCQNQRKQTRGVSKFKGVSWRRDRCLWVAYIRSPSRRLFLGYFETEIEAAAAYDAAALIHFGEFARVNLPQEPAGL